MVMLCHWASLQESKGQMSKHGILRQPWPGAGEMAQQLTALATLPEDVSLVPSTYTELHNRL